jgi:hypothetical protein
MLRGAIASLSTGTYVVTRHTAGTYVDGIYTSGPSALVVGDDVVEAVDVVADTLQLTAHGLLTGDGPVQLTTTGTLPAGATLATDYWVVRSSANLLRLATSVVNAMAIPAVVVDLTDAGTGTHTIVDTAETERLNRETFSIVASVQPTSGRDLQDIPAERRGDEVRLVITETALRTIRPGNDPDYIDLDGEPWRIIKVERWQSFGAVHYEAFAARDVPGP